MPQYQLSASRYTLSADTDTEPDCCAAFGVLVWPSSATPAGSAAADAASCGREPRCAERRPHRVPARLRHAAGGSEERGRDAAGAACCAQPQSAGNWLHGIARSRSVYSVVVCVSFYPRLASPPPPLHLLENGGGGVCVERGGYQ
eukprot:Rhum_TRINITY_DN12589_c1_g1::Rhum_TRINITY_DN12589_c1_g1_i1::g.53000::m.53000